MLDILKFLFSDFWHWLGAFLMIVVIAESFGNFIRIVIKTKE